MFSSVRHRTASLLGQPLMRVTRYAALAFAVGGPAAAATYSVNVQGPMDLGRVAAAPVGDTVFRMDASSGAVTVQNGGGRRLAAGPVRAQVTISCRPSREGDTDCATANIPMRAGVIGTLSGRARALTNFNVAPGTASLVGAPTGSNPVLFTLAPLGADTPRTFFIGADFPVAGDDAGLPTGAGQNNFYVYALDGAGAMLAGDSDRGRVTALRAVAVSKTADLSFGRLQRPTSGANTVTLDAASGARTVSGAGDGIAYPTPAPTRAAFTVTGEGGQQVSVSIPSSLTLTGPGAIPVDVTTTAVAAPTLAGAAGAQGAYSFTVGGSLTLTPGTPTGDFAGVLTVSVDYN